MRGDTQGLGLSRPRTHARGSRKLLALTFSVPNGILPLICFPPPPRQGDPPLPTLYLARPLSVHPHSTFKNSNCWVESSSSPATITFFESDCRPSMSIIRKRLAQIDSIISVPGEHSPYVSLHARLSFLTPILNASLTRSTYIGSRPSQINDDIVPLPPHRRTWTRTTFNFFWLATWSVLSALLHIQALGVGDSGVSERMGRLARSKEAFTF